MAGQEGGGAEAGTRRDGRRYAVGQGERRQGARRADIEGRNRERTTEREGENVERRPMQEFKGGREKRRKEGSERALAGGSEGEGVDAKERRARVRCKG